MKKIIPFTKDIKFNTKIYEIISISLENTLTIEENGEIDGEFVVSGEYKINDASINTEPFIYGLPFDISIDDNYEMDSLKVDIDDFKYEIINEEILRVNIDVLLEGKVKIEIDEKEEKNEEIIPDILIEARKESFINEEISKNDDMKGDEMNTTEEVKDLFKQEEKVVSVSNITDDNKIESIFDNFSSEDEKYVSYYVHIVRENDTLESISLKYNTDINIIKEYNDVDKITQFNKLIIPFVNDKKI